MTLTAEDVKNKQFTPTRFKGGYDEKEVNAALRKYLEGYSDEAITELEVPTGIPFRMRLTDDLAVESAEYLGDPEAALAAAAAVRRQSHL